MLFAKALTYLMAPAIILESLFMIIPKDPRLYKY